MRRNGPRVVAVGGPPAFHPQVARALSADPDAIQWLPTVTGAENVLLGAPEPFDLLVVSPIVKEADAAGVAQFVTRRSPRTAVVVVRDRVSNGSLPVLIRSGVRDVVDLSRGADDLRDALHRALEWAKGIRSAGGDGAGGEAERRGTIVSIFSTKGGTGKTFLSCNLAAALASRSSERTALLDLDLRSGDAFAYFGAEPRRPLRDLATLEKGPDLEVVADMGTPLGRGLVGFGSPPDPQAASIGSEAMGEILRALRSSFAYTVVDATYDYSDQVLAAFDLSDLICLITGLDVIGVRHLSMAMRTLENLGVPRDRVRIVLNRADSKVELVSDDIERVLRVRVDAKIPSSVLVPRSINRSRLLWFDEPRSAVAKSISELAEKILAQTRPDQVASPAAAPRRAWRR
jgi:pilus assembly protein CpaE